MVIVNHAVVRFVMHYVLLTYCFFHKCLFAGLFHDQMMSTLLFVDNEYRCIKAFLAVSSLILFLRRIKTLLAAARSSSQGSLKFASSLLSNEQQIDCFRKQKIWLLLCFCACLNGIFASVHAWSLGTACVSCSIVRNLLSSPVLF